MILLRLGVASLCLWLVHLAQLSCSPLVEEYVMLLVNIGKVVGDVLVRYIGAAN